MQVFGGVDAIADDQHAVVKAFGVTQELQRVRHSSNVKLKGVGVDADGDGTILGEPLGDGHLICRQLHRPIHRHLGKGSVEVAGFIIALVRVIVLYF